MTTIAVKDGIMCADKRLTAGDTVYKSNAVKIYDVDGIITGFSGDWREISKYLDWLDVDHCCDVPGVDLSFVELHKDGTIYHCDCDDSGYVHKDEVEGNIFADGSGFKFALGALHFGASPEEAIKFTAQYDIYTGDQEITTAYYNEDGELVIEHG